jgi:1-phosphatidylinositol phosphodiesterase
MFRTSTRLLGACMALSCLAFLPVGQAAAHWDDAYFHDYHDLPSQSRWMAMLDDKTPLNRITMPGTHGSAARHGGWITENQTLTIPQQLNAGIRYLDLRVRHINDKFALHHGDVYQYQMFGDALNAVVAFLRANPTETVLVRLKDEEHTDHGNTRPFVETLDSYYPQFGAYFAKDVRLDQPLGSLRGKAVLLRKYSEWNYDRPARDSYFGPIDYKQGFVEQDEFQLDTNWSLYAKWEKVKAHIDVANEVGRGDTPVPFVNFLSGSGGAFPYFVASGHSDPRTDAPGLVTGKVTPFFNDWPDFPRGACFIGMCTIYFEGTNTLTKNYLRTNESIRYAGIIVADFPGAGLIQAIIDVNRVNSHLISLKNAQCMDIEGGVSAGRNLMTWACHGGANQRFIVRGDQIMVGGLCLDVEGNRNVHGARVLAWPCHGGQNQRWKLEANGTIRSLMPGVERCLDVFSEERNRIGLWQCHPSSPDQQFREIFRTPTSAGIAIPA